MPAGARFGADRARAALDRAQREGRLALDDSRSAITPYLCQHCAQLGEQALRRQRVCLVLVDDAPPRRFVCCCQGGRRVGDVEIQQWLQGVGGLCADHAEQHEEELLLPFGEFANRREQAREVLLALTLLDRGRMRA